MNYEEFLAFLVKYGYIELTEDKEIDKKHIEVLQELIEFLKEEKNRMIVKNYSILIQKQNFLLRLLNYILKNLGKKEIISILDFPEFPKSKLIDSMHFDYIQNNKIEILKLYKKNDISWHRRNSTEYYTIFLIKKLYNELNINYSFVIKQETENSDPESYYGIQE